MLRSASDVFVGSWGAPVGARLGSARPFPLRALAPRSAPVPAPATPPVGGSSASGGRLSKAERQALREIARALIAPNEAPPPATIPAGPRAVRDEAVYPPAAEMAARLRELSSILDTVSDGIILIDASARILSLNRSAEALFGFDQEEVAGERLTRLFAADSHAGVLDYFAELQRRGVGGIPTAGRTLSGQVRQGGTFPVAMTMGRIGEDDEGRFCVVLRDATARQSAERDVPETRQSAPDESAHRSEFLAKLSHEIRTPLNTVIGFAEIMLEERFGPIGTARYLDYVGDIRNAGAQVVRLVDRLLDLSRIESGGVELAFTGVSLNAIVTGIVAGTQGQALRGRIVLRTSFGANLPLVLADAESIRRIVDNLVANAMAFTEPGGQVIVSTAATERGEVVFRVRDTGIGMSRAEIEAALEPLRSVGSRQTGAGLGLPLTKALVEANRGELQITSAPRQGTLAEVLFPAARVLSE